MNELLLYGFFPSTALFLWLIARKVSKKTWVQLLLMMLGLTLTQVGLFLMEWEPSSTENRFIWDVTFIFAFFYFPCMLIMLVFLIVLRMMRASS